MNPLIINLCLLFSLLAPSAFAKTRSSKPEARWSVAETQLRKAGFKKTFIRQLKKVYKPGSFREVVELNTLLFLKKSDYHGTQVTDEAAQAVRQFLTQNRLAFDQAERDYEVPGDVVASLLWIESRHGENMGQFHMASVFVHLLQAERPDVLKYLAKNAEHYSEKPISKNDRKEIALRAHKRVQWALAELKAIAKMQAADPTTLASQYSSFAGAFGMAQFEPSSYIAYAKPFQPNTVPNLSRAQDAIQSVAFYLHENGWRTFEAKTLVSTLMKYNNSQDYATAILKLATLAKREQSKATTSAQSE